MPRRPWLAVLLVAAAVLVAYLPSLRNGFVWNDSDYVTRPELRSLPGLERIWFEPGATEQYYPALHSAFWAEHRIWGDSPLGYHLANLFLHAAAAALFMFILRRLTAGAGLAPAAAADSALLGGLLFALHPVCVESVAWIAEQKNTLSLVFALASVLLYLRWRETSEKGSPRPRLYLMATGLFLAAVLSKSMTATFPAALLVIAWWQSGRIGWRRDVRPLLPWFVAGAADGLFTAWVERRFIGAEGPEFGLSFLQRGLVAGHAVWFYLGKLVWPSPLIFMYPRWQVAVADLRQGLLLLAALAVLAGCWLARRRSRTPLAVALLFGGMLFPVLGFFNVYAFVFSFVADHFQYVACLPVLGVAAAGWGCWAHRPQRSPLLPTVTAAALLLVLGALTWRQCGDYRDEATLYRKTLAKNPDSWLAHYNLGNLLRASGQVQEAIGHYEATLRINSRHAEAENNLGLALAETGEPAQAIPHYERSLRLQPGYAVAENNLGTAQWALGRNGAALLAYHAAVDHRPDYAEAWYNLGLAYGSAGQPAAAVEAFARAVHLRPEFTAAIRSLAGARTNLGIALFGSGHQTEGLEQLEDAVRLDPASAAIQLNLAIALRAVGRTNEAAQHYQESRRLGPNAAMPPAAPLSGAAGGMQTNH